MGNLVAEAAHRALLMLLALAVLAVGVSASAMAQGEGATLEISGFKVEGGPSPAPGGQAKVEFTLRNVTGRTIRLGSRLGVFLAAKVALPGQEQPMRRNFGKQLVGGELAPGQSFVFRDSLVWDLSGAWTLAPACQLADEVVFFEQQAVTVVVGGQGATKPTPFSAAPSAPRPATVPAQHRPSASASCAGENICLKVLSYNIASTTASRDPVGWNEMLGILAREKPDLLVLPETVATDVPLIARAAGLPHFEGIKAYGAEEWRPRVGLCSRWPMKIRQVALPVSGGEKERRFGLAEVDVDGIPVAIYAIHLSREGLVDGKLKGMVKELLGAGRRQEEMETVVRELARDPRRLKVLAGDLNTFPLSGPYRLLEKSLVDAFPAEAPGTYRMDRMGPGEKAKATAVSREQLPNPKIDHIFHSQGLRAQEARVITQGPSDHYPIMARLQLDLGDHSLEPARVKAAQEFLIKVGLLTGSASGRLDPATRRAVARLQAMKGLPIDGMLGERTLKLLGI